LGGHSFNPVHPVHQDDTNDQCHNEIVTTFNYSNTDLTNNVSPSGFIFSPEQYAKGLAITGVQDLPSWVKSFSIVKTKPIKRVICQGIGTYSFVSDNSGSKNTRKFWFYSQELDELNTDILGATQVQFVSPLGYHTEVYNAFKNGGDKGIDMVSYARLLTNQASGNYTNDHLKRHNAAGTDINSYYTEHGAWRHVEAAEGNNPFQIGGNIDGDKIFPILNVSQKTSGRFSYFEIELDGLDLYNYTDATNEWATSLAAQKFHEPFYLVNIINDAAEIPSSNTTTYYETGHHQKVESIIGTGTGAGQSLQLCDERYEDCIPSEYSDNRDLIYNFIFLRNKISGQEQRWLNITHLDPSSGGLRDQIITSLNTTGEYTIPSASLYPNPYSSIQDIVIQGAYTSDWNMSSDENGRDAEIVLGNINNSSGVALNSQYCIPDAQNYIVVKYDNRFPLKVFGGDTVISEDTTCFIDGKNDNNGNDESGIHYLNTPLPYNGIKFNNSKYIRVKNAENTLNKFQVEDIYGLEYIRQWAVNFFHETNLHMPYEYDDIVGTGSAWAYKYRRNFPRTHYIMRPEKWQTCDSSVHVNDNFEFGGGVLSDIYNNEAYYGYEWQGMDNANWGYGGFICNNYSSGTEFGAYYNVDYQKDNNYLPATSKPVVGFTEITDFCSRIIWSEQRNIAQQNVPNLKTFLGTSLFDIEDAYGEIKRAFNAETSKGDNLYAFTNNGIALLLTGKEMSQDAVGSVIAYVRTPDRFISGRIWLRADVGMNDEMWRSAAEWAKTIFWANSESSYMMFDNQVTDIGRMNYRKRLFYDGLNHIKANYLTNVSGVFNRNNNEYWLNIAQTAKSVAYDKDLIPSTTNYFSLGQTSGIGISYLVEDRDWLNITAVDTLMNMIVLPTDFSVGMQLTFTNSAGASIRVFDVSVLTTTILTGTTITLEFNGTSWIIATNPKLNETFVFFVDGEIQGWEGTFSYNFEKMICLNQKVYGIRDGIIYETDLGYQINGSVIESSLKSVANKEQPYDKESISILVNTPLSKPSRVDFANSIAALPECSLYADMSVPPNARYLREYGQGRWTNLIPRKIATGRPRLQGRMLVFDIIHSEAEDFVVVDSVIEYKNMKLQQ